MRYSLKEILLIPLIFVIYLFRIILDTVCFIGKIISNIFEKKSKKTVIDIVAIHYYSEEWPDLVELTLFYDDKCFPKELKKLDSDFKISKIDFNIFLEAVKNNRIISKKRYILNWPYVSFREYLSWFFACDAGPTKQVLTLYFKDGTSKNIIGYSKELDELREELEKLIDDKDTSYV